MINWRASSGADVVVGGGGARVHATNLPFHTFYQRRRRGFLRLIQQRIVLRRRFGINRNSYFYSRQLSGHLSPPPAPHKHTRSSASVFG